MKIFRKISLKGFNHKVKAKLKAKSCVQLPIDQLSFDELTPSDQGVVVVRLSPKDSSPMDGRTFIPRHHSVSFDLEDDVEGPLAPNEGRVKSWFSDSSGNGVCLSESVCSVMVLNEEEYLAETEGNVQGSPTEDTGYQYHYKLRRHRKEETHDHDLSGSPPVGDLTAQQYARLRDSGLISTSFDEYRPIPGLESGADDDASAQRHPKLQVIFDNDDDNERNSKELFLDAGLWAGPTRTTAVSTPTTLSLSRINPTQRKSVPKSSTVDVAASGSCSEEADTGFYMHDNDSMSNLPGSIDSKSTNLFSEEPFSPQFVDPNPNGLNGGSFASCDSITTEDNVGGVPDNGVQPSSASIDKFVTEDNLVVTPTRTTAQISLVAPPNTPWDSGTPDTLQLVTRTSQESTRRRARGTKNASTIPKSMFDKVPKEQSKVAFEEDYSFISFSTPTRVALGGTRKRVALGGGGKKGGGQMVAKAMKAKFNRTFKKPVGNEATAAHVSVSQVRPTKTSPATVSKCLKPSTPPLSAFPSFANAEVVAVTPVSDSPPIIQCPDKADKPAATNGESNHEGDDTVPISSFVESLNKALDMLESLVDQQTSMAPTLAYESVAQANNGIATESIDSDPAEASVGSTNGSPTPVGFKLGRTLSRFSGPKQTTRLQALVQEESRLVPVCDPSSRRNANDHGPGVGGLAAKVSMDSEPIPRSTIGRSSNCIPFSTSRIDQSEPRASLQKEKEGKEKTEAESAGRRLVSVDASFKMPGAYGAEERKNLERKAIANEDTHGGPEGMMNSEMRHSMLVKTVAEFFLG